MCIDLWLDFCSEQKLRICVCVCEREKMGDKEEVLEAVLKETVDLVIDLNRLLSSLLPVCVLKFVLFVLKFWPLEFCSFAECRKTYPLRKYLRI